MLRDNALPAIMDKMRNKPFIFMQDNAPLHNKREEKNLPMNVDLMLNMWKRRNGLVSNFIKRIKWVPYSPDLNCIENVWHLLNIKKNELINDLIIEEKPLPKNKKEMFELIQLAWHQLDNETVKTIYRSFLNRMRKVIRYKGNNNFKC